MIYFDKPTQAQVLSRFEPLMKSGGLLFAGHSENFTYVTQAFKLRGQTVYELTRDAGSCAQRAARPDATGAHVASGVSCMSSACRSQPICTSTTTSSAPA